ncbi:MAG: hypothetical protein LRZ85_08330 [Alphaproteobacteria bacterium]|nr:hypothetical protein [Alphaproteobacteria bacterium]
MGEIQALRAGILGKIAAIFKEFNKLAARSGTDITSLTKNLPNATLQKAPDAHEGMLGSLILEQLISPVFSAVAADFMVNTSQGSITGTITAVDLFQSASALDETLDPYKRHAADDIRFKKGAGKGTEALIHGNTAKPKMNTLFNGIFNDGGRGFFYIPLQFTRTKTSGKCSYPGISTAYGHKPL